MLRKIILLAIIGSAFVSAFPQMKQDCKPTGSSCYGDAECCDTAQCLPYYYNGKGMCVDEAELEEMLNLMEMTGIAAENEAELPMEDFPELDEEEALDRVVAENAPECRLAACHGHGPEIENVETVDLDQVVAENEPPCGPECQAEFEDFEIEAYPESAQKECSQWQFCSNDSPCCKGMTCYTYNSKGDGHCLYDSSSM